MAIVDYIYAKPFRFTKGEAELLIQEFHSPLRFSQG